MGGQPVPAIANITLDKLSQFYAESVTENQKNLCFHPQVMEKLFIYTSNEIVYDNMRRNHSICSARPYSTRQKTLRFSNPQLVQKCQLILT